MQARSLPDIDRRSFLGATAALLLAPQVQAQGGWPTARPIDWIVPYPTGGSTDVLGRAVAQLLATSLATPVIVDNKAGATGTIGGGFVAKAAPDGFTVLGTSIGPQAIAPHLMHLPYDPLRDLQPVVTIGTIPHILVVGEKQPFKTVADLIAAAKAQPGRLSFASGGIGTILQMQGEWLKQQTGVSLIHVPYKGDTPALLDTLSNVVNFMFAPAAAALPHVLAGKLRALAVTSAERLAALPNVPTMTQAGFRNFVVEQWQAVYLPARTPAAIVQRLNGDINKALANAAVVDLARKLGVTLVGGTPQALQATQVADSAKWAQVIRDGHITAD
ncbi:MAG: tripartite tricarboxylate transporter substrate binding protein [Burkholderiales bacterium]|nr:tripartite tricarboxylate transporter substrate binding protein [Burkholderiales bacterium]